MFIKLTATDGDRFYANLDRVDCMVSKESGNGGQITELQFIGESNLMLVKETPEEILALIVGDPGPLTYDELTEVVRTALLSTGAEVYGDGTAYRLAIRVVEALRGAIRKASS